MGPSTLMGPRLASSYPRWLILACIGLGTLVICIAILSLALIYSEPQTSNLPVASAVTADQHPSVAPTPPPVLTQPLGAATTEKQDDQPAAERPAAEKPAAKTSEKPLQSVNDLKVSRGAIPAAKQNKRLSKKKRRAIRRWQKQKALLKRRRARRKRARAAKRRRARRARLASAQRSRQKRSSRTTRRQGRHKASELDDLLTGL